MIERFRKWKSTKRSCDWAWYFVVVMYGSMFLYGIAAVLWAPERGW